MGVERTPGGEGPYARSHAPRAEATNAAAYDACNPTTVNQVFTNVVGNF